MKKRIRAHQRLYYMKGSESIQIAVAHDPRDPQPVNHAILTFQPIGQDYVQFTKEHLWLMSYAFSLLGTFCLLVHNHAYGNSGG